MSTRFAAFRYRNFRLLWIGYLISFTGSQMQIVAINWHIYILTHSAAALGLIGFMRFLPLVIFSPIGGSFADIYNRKKVALVTQTIFAIFSAILALTTFRHSINPFLIYALGAASAITMAFDMPARQAFVPNLIKREHFASAMSLMSIMWETAVVVGSSITGFLIAHAGLGNIYAINTVTYLAVIGALLTITATGQIEGPITTISISSIKEGFSFVRGKTIIWSSMLLDFFSTFFSSATALLPIFASDILRVGPQGLGFLYAAPSIGAVTAGFVIAHIGTIKKQGKILLTAVAFYGLGTIIFGLSKVFLLSFVGLLIVGAGDSVSTIIRNTIRQLETPDYIRGRMTSINMIFFMGGPQLGEFEAGLLAAATTAPISVVVGGIGTLIVVAAMAAAIPVLRKLD